MHLQSSQDSLENLGSSALSFSEPSSQPQVSSSQTYICDSDRDVQTSPTVFQDPFAKPPTDRPKIAPKTLSSPPPISEGECRRSKEIIPQPYDSNTTLTSSQGAPSSTSDRSEHESLPQNSDSTKDFTSMQQTPSSQTDVHTRASSDSIATEPIATASRASIGSAASQRDYSRAQGLRRTSSNVRLSMSLEGKAQITMDHESSPSPPRISPTPLNVVPRRRSFQRWHSAIEPAHCMPNNLSQYELPRLKRSITGRSKDARSWEFYCDSEARDALTTHAEQDQNGSAAGAIALIRSSSRATMPGKNDRSEGKSAKPDAFKRKSAKTSEDKKPKLARTASSVARLQTVKDNTLIDISNSPAPKDADVKPKSQPTIFTDNSGDSDKENWMPGTRLSNVRRQRPAKSPGRFAQRAVLTENSQVPSHSSSLGAMLSRDKKSSHQSKASTQVGKSKGSTPEIDAEFGEFMNDPGLVQEEEDLDCVQSLLSLSQGAWR